MIPRLPVNIPLWGIATISPKGVTRFCSSMPCVPPGSFVSVTAASKRQRSTARRRRICARSRHKYPVHDFNDAASLPDRAAPACAPRPRRNPTANIVLNPPVTRDGYGQLVGRTRAGDGSNCFGRADPASDFRVGDRLARGDFLKRLPHPLLEGGTANIERQIEAETRRLDEPDDTRYEGFVVAVGPDQLRLGKAILKVADQLAGVAAEEDGRDAFLARSHQNGAERALSDREADVLVRAAGAILCRRHAEHVGRLLVEASARIEPGVVDRLGHGVAARETLTDLRRAMGSSVILGRQACGCLEHAVEITGAATDPVCQLGQRRVLLALLDQTTGLCDDDGVFAVD